MFRSSMMIAAVLGSACAGFAQAPLQRSTKPTRTLYPLGRELPPLFPKTVDADENIAKLTPILSAPRAAAQPYSLPFFMAPTMEQMLNECVVIDANGDARDGYNAWSFMEYFGNPAYWADKPAGDADDWLIFPAINIPDVSKALKVSLDARATGLGTTESLEVRIGTAPAIEALDKVVMSEPGVPCLTNYEFTHYNSLFALDKPGVYYLAVRCTSSQSSGWRMLIQNLKLEQATDVASVPDGCTNLKAVEDSKGALKMTVSFTMPTHTLNGVALDPGTPLTAIITTPAETKTVQATSGQYIEEMLSAVDGLNVVKVEVVNAQGDGSRRVTTARCGIDIPCTPVVRGSVSDDNLTFTLTWDPVTEGVNGGIIDPDGVTYIVYRYMDDGSWAVMDNDCKDCTYSVSVPKGSVLSYCDLAVSAANEKGFVEETPIVSAVIGEPYLLPLKETFDGGQAHYAGMSIDAISSEYQGQFAFGDPSQLDAMFGGGPSYALFGVSPLEEGTRGHVALPKVTTKGKKDIQLTLPMFVYEDGPEIEVYAETNSGERYTLGTVDQSKNTGWTDLIYNLPVELYDQSCVGVNIDIRYRNNYSGFMLGGYSLVEGQAGDMAMTNLQVEPKVLEIGKKATVTAIVRNSGLNAEKAPEVVGTVNLPGAKMPIQLVFTPADPDANIEVGATMSYTSEFTLNTADYADKYVTISANIATPDSNEQNDRMNLDVTVAGVASPLITDLSAAYVEEDGSIALSWTNPVSDETLDTFENYESFIYDSHIGPWLNLDFDMAAPYTLAEVEGIIVPDDTEPKAFQVISASESNLASYGMYGYNGSDKMLMAFSPVDATADDWLISPRIKGGFEISFMWSILSSEFTETIEVLYSTTANDVDSFKGVAARLTKSTTDWEEATVQIPNDARYFAIHYVSHDCFGIMIDDFLYYPSTPEYALHSYSVLRDNEKVATLPADATSYIDNDVERDAEYTYHVLPTFTHNGMEEEGVLSNAVVLKAAGIEDVKASPAGIYGTTGAIVIKGHEGETLYLYNAQGQKLRAIIPAGPLHVERVDAGLYIISGSKVIVK